MKRVFGKKTVFIFILSLLLVLGTDAVLAKDDVTIPINQKITSASLGESHYAAVTADGELYIWGAHDLGQLGDGISREETSEDIHVPEKILDHVIDVSLGLFNSAAVTEDGSLYTWGYNISGKLGNGIEDGETLVPTKIMDDVASVSLGESHSAAITRDGSLYTWGWNSYGQLGDGTTENKYVPTKIMDDVVSVSLGGETSAAITKDGSLYTWGSNYHGQLGDGTTENKYVPTKILDDVVSVSLGECHSAAITKDGFLYIWGWNSYGQLGDGTTEDNHVPMKIMEDVISVSLGNTHSAAITKDGSLYTWGDNVVGQLGDGTTEENHKPTKILDNIASVSLGRNNTAAITKSGSYLIWGWCRYCELGNGEKDFILTPVTIFDGSSSSTETTVVSLSKYSMNLTIGNTETLTATVSPSTEDQTVNWQSSDTSIATVSDGKITAISAGTANITATTVDGQTAICKVTVTKPNVTSVSLNKTKAELWNEETVSLNASVVPINADSTITWTTSDSSIATVSDGKVTATAKGTATITATSINGKSATCEITVKGFKPTSLIISKSTASIDIGSPLFLTATVYPTEVDQTINWTTSDPSVATVSNGTVEGVKAGTAIITATNATGLTATCKVNVSVPIPSSVSINKSYTRITLGTSETLSATVYPKAADQTVIWNSSDPSVATVSDGMVTGLKTGSADITAETINGETTTCKVVIVYAPATKVTLSSSSINLSAGDTEILTATVSPSTASPFVTWESNDQDVAKVSDGKIFAVSVGTATITAKSKDEKESAFCKVTVDNNDIPIDEEIVSVSLGSYHSAAITKDGSLYTWGDNSYGQLGDGTTIEHSVPEKIMTNVASVSLGGTHSAAITKDGSLYTWGSNSYGQLGDGTTTRSSKPIKIAENVISVALGGAHSAAITKDGSLYTWGDNSYGQLGDGTITSSSKPIKIMDNIASVSLGSIHSAAVSKDGSLYTWGHNYYGELGKGPTEDSHTPIKVMDNVDSVSLGSHHSAAITKDGSLYIWGDNFYKQLGYFKKYYLSPQKIMENVESVSLGSYHSAAVTKDGSLFTWGRDYAGELGYGTWTTHFIKPQKVMTNIASVSLGYSRSAALTKNGSLFTWGYNSDGQLGDGTKTSRRAPTLIFGHKQTASSVGLSLLDSPIKVILGKRHTVNGSYIAYGDGSVQTELNTINWTIDDESIAKVSKMDPVLSSDENSASGPLVEIQGLKPGVSQLNADLTGIETAGKILSFDLAVGPAMTLPGTTVINQKWDTVINQNTQKITFEVKASLNEPDEEYLKYFGENTKVSLEETPNSLVNGGGEVSRVYSISEDGKDITITITFVTDSEVFDRLIVIESPIETKRVRVINNNLNIGFKADRDGWILTNSHAAFGYSQDKDKSSLYQKLYPDSWEEINPTDLTEKWEGNCAGLSALSVLNYNNQINLKGLFENPDGSLYKYGQTGKAIYSKDLDFNTYTIKENQNVIDVIEKAQVLQNTYEFEDCRVFKGKNLRDGIIQYYLDGNKQPLYIGMDCKYKINDDDDEYRNFSHAIVTDTSKEIVEPTDQDPCYYIKIYDCIYPYSDSRGGRFSSDIKENPERLISQYFNNMWLKLDPENDEWQEVYRDSDGQFKTADYDIHYRELQSLDAGYGLQSLQFYDLSATDKFNLILEENPGKFTKRITTLDKSLYIASRLVINSGKFVIKTIDEILVETDPACNQIFSDFEGGMNLLSEKTGDSSAYTFDLEKHEDYNIEGDQFTLTLYGEDMSIGIESDGKNEFNVDLEDGSITVIPEDHSKVSVNIQRKLGSDYKAVSVNSFDLNSEVTLKFSSDGQVEVENQASNPVELSYLINHVAVTQDEFESSDYSLSDQAKELIEAIDKEDVNTLQKEDLERIQNLLDQYAALSDKDKALIPEETKNQAAALTDWLNNLNETDTPSDPSESENPADPGTQEIPSDSGSQSSGTKDPVSMPGLNDQDGTQKIDTVSQNVSQKIERTYRIAPGTGISDNTIIGWMIVLTAVLAAGTISHLFKRRFDSKN